MPKSILFDARQRLEEDGNILDDVDYEKEDEMEAEYEEMERKMNEEMERELEWQRTEEFQRSKEALNNEYREMIGYARWQSAASYEEHIRSSGRLTRQARESLNRMVGQWMTSLGRVCHCGAARQGQEMSYHSESEDEVEDFIERVRFEDEPVRQVRGCAYNDYYYWDLSDPEDESEPPPPNYRGNPNMHNCSCLKEVLEPLETYQAFVRSRGGAGTGAVPSLKALSQRTVNTLVDLMDYAQTLVGFDQQLELYGVKYTRVLPYRLSYTEKAKRTEAGRALDKLHTTVYGAVGVLKQMTRLRSVIKEQTDASYEAHVERASVIEKRIRELEREREVKLAALMRV